MNSLKNAENFFSSNTTPTQQYIQHHNTMPTPLHTLELVTQRIADYDDDSKPRPPPLGPESSLRDIQQYLYQLQLNYGDYEDSWHIILKVVAFIDGTQRLNWSEYKGMQECLTFGEFLRERMPGGGSYPRATIRLGIFGTFTKTYVGKKKVDWEKEDFHAWAVAIRNSTNTASGKDLFIWDCNTDTYASWARDRTDIETTLYKPDLLGMQLKFIKYLVEKRRFRLHNVYMAGNGNTGRECLQLTVNWTESMMSHPGTLLPESLEELNSQGWRRVKWDNNPPLSGPQRAAIEVVLEPLEQLTAGGDDGQTLRLGDPIHVGEKPWGQVEAGGDDSPSSPLSDPPQSLDDTDLEGIANGVLAVINHQTEDS